MTKSRQRAFPKDLGLDECALCGADPEAGLRLSHVVPSFVFLRLKDTAVTGGLRAAGTPNLRRQDGWKARLLCGECETRLGVW